MENCNSRFITYPSTVEKSQNHTVLLIDPDIADIERVGLFCKTSHKDYDIYLYNGESGDLEWLNYLESRVDWLLINESSHVIITGSEKVERRKSSDILAYFQEFDTK